MIKTIKYIVLSAAVAVFTVTACTKNELEQPVGQEGVTIFTGGFIESKISLGEKEGNGYPALWDKDDKIAIYNSDNGKLIGIITNRDMKFETDMTQLIDNVMTKENLVLVH